MKFKEQRGNVFVFDVDGCELECRVSEGKSITYGKVKVFPDLCVIANERPFSTIQRSVQMMQILIDRGLA